MRRKLRYILYPTLISLCLAAGFYAQPIYKQHFTQPTFIHNILNEENIATVTSTTTPSAHHLLDKTVRVQTPSGNGSGVILFSEKYAESDTYYSYVATNAHVVKMHKAVSVVKFKYFNYRTVESTEVFTGKVVARSSVYDLAIIEIKTTKKLPSARFLPRPEFSKVQLFDQVYISGCPLSNNPIVIEGRVANIEDRNIITTAFAIFGSSGGGVYTESGKLIGLINKVSSYDDDDDVHHAVGQLSHVIPVNLVVPWLRSRRLPFVYTHDKDSFEAFVAARKAKKFY